VPPGSDCECGASCTAPNGAGGRCRPDRGDRGGPCRCQELPIGGGGR
jgi:hypothetical protein